MGSHHVTAHNTEPVVCKEWKPLLLEYKRFDDVQTLVSGNVLKQRLTFDVQTLKTSHLDLGMLEPIRRALQDALQALQPVLQVPAVTLGHPWDETVSIFGDVWATFLGGDDEILALMAELRHWARNAPKDEGYPLDQDMSNLSQPYHPTVHLTFALRVRLEMELVARINSVLLRVSLQATMTR
jgi:hypothetical protein